MWVVLIGPSGSGKSTLLRCINQLENIQGGDIQFEGTSIVHGSVDINRVRQRIGMVFQHFNLFPHLTVLENITLGPRDLRKLPVDQANALAEQLLERVGLADKRDVYPNQLSGGQKQRIAIAGMLAMQPEVLVLDEATAMLDPRGRREILSIVSRLHREKGITVVMITQYMEEATIADRVAVMADGKLLLEGPPREVFRQTALLRQHRLDIPAMTELKERLNAHGAGLPEDILTVEDMAEAICQSLLKN